MVGACRVVLEGGLDEAHRLVDGDRGQRHAFGDVADGENVFDVGPRELVDDDLALGTDRDTGRLKPEPLGVRLTSECQHHLVGRQHLPVGQMRVEAAIPAFLDPVEDRVAQDADTLLLHGLVQRPPQVHVEASEDLAAAVYQRRLDAQAMEDVGEFHRNIAAAGDNDRFRQFFEVEGLIGRDAQFMAGKRRMRVGAAARGDQDPVCRDGPVLGHEANRVGVDEFGAGVEDLGTGVLEPLAVETLQPGDFAVLVGDQRLPVERRLGDRPAVAGRILEMLRKLRCVDEQLLRHAAADHARAAVTKLLGNRDLLSERRGHPARTYAARAAADHEQVVVEIRHVASLPRSVSTAALQTVVAQVLTDGGGG